jgi:diadenosine tetraphosphatase ApaH/serine/threonine PP2A family protein phosphatase
MRYLVLSDLHANLQALDAVLSDAAVVGYDHVLLLGDLVGYGGDPAPVMDRVLSLAPLTTIRGNHDKVCAGLVPATEFNDAARIAAEWTTATLDAGHLQALAVLPPGPSMAAPDLQICHGAPFDEDFYIFDESDAEQAFEAAEGRVCLFGHTHVPALFASAGDPFCVETEEGLEFRLPATGPALINVGSVGQPRDRDPRAAYGVLDLDRGTIALRRVAYDIQSAQAAILGAGLPAWLAYRLERGQ